MRYKINNINSFDFGLFIGVIEFFALLFMGFLMFNLNLVLISVLWGILIGFFAVFMTLLIFNNLKKGIRLKFNKLQEIKKVSVLSVSILSGCFLTFLFFVQKLFSNLLNFGDYFGRVLLGFIASFVAVVFGLMLYNFGHLKFKLLINNKKFIIKKFGIISCALFVALLEMIIIPLLFVGYNIFDSFILLGIGGFVSGFVGGASASFIYNKIGFPIVLEN
jgi:hypothetical protein